MKPLFIDCWLTSKDFVLSPFDPDQILKRPMLGYYREVIKTLRREKRLLLVDDELPWDAETLLCGATAEFDDE